MLVETATKKCSGCKAEKELMEFGKNQSRKDGLHSDCKECRRDYWQSEGGKETCRKASQKYHQTERGKEHSRIIDRRRKLLHPEKVKARNAVHKAIQSGRLIRPPICESCFEECLVEGHHESYEKEKWLDVDWMCIKCHREYHAKTRK